MYMKQILVLLVVTMIAQQNCITMSKEDVLITAAHAAKYGHHRYGRTYKGIMRDWEPGKKFIL